MSQGERVTFPGNTQRSAAHVACDSPSPCYEVSELRCDMDTPYHDFHQVWFLMGGATHSHVGVCASQRHICRGLGKHLLGATLWAPVPR